MARNFKEKTCQVQSSCQVWININDKNTSTNLPGLSDLTGYDEMLNDE